MEIIKEEYDHWLDTSNKVGKEYCKFSSFCGGFHEFGIEIEKDGMLYELSSAWEKTKYFYYIKCLSKSFGQEGDGI
jgi:hypothetical protein